MDLESLGWDAAFAESFQPHEQDGLAPARVAVEHRSEYVVYVATGELRAELSGRLRHEQEYPAVGDWIAIAHVDEDRALIHAVLPRRIAFVRKAWRYWLSRRSRTSSIPWDKFERILEVLPLPRPRIIHQV